MALEAARQISIEAGVTMSQRQLRGVHFDEPLPFVKFEDPEAYTEIQVMARPVDEAGTPLIAQRPISSFNFEILSADAREGNCWTRHCHGIFAFATILCEKATNEHVVVEHDRYLLENSPLLDIDIDNNIYDLQLSRKGAKGKYIGLTEDLSHYFIDPLALNSILSQPKAYLLQIGLPVAHRMLRLSKMIVPYTAGSFVGGSYSTKIEKTYPCGASANIHLE